MPHRGQAGILGQAGISVQARFIAFLLVSALSTAAGAEPQIASTPVLHQDFDVIVVGGSTAALAAAVTAAQQGARTALLEPTDWIGGQITSSGVPAVDECWHRILEPNSKSVLVDAAGMARDPRNMNPVFREMLFRTGNPGRGWVSRFCFEPTDFLARELLPYTATAGDRLEIFLNTVIKHVETEPASRRIVGLEAIRRIPRPEVKWHGYDRLPSLDLKDWYSAIPSARFDKERLEFQARPGTVFIDASEWGELLVLSGAQYLQGVERSESAEQGDDTLGQCITFCFVEVLAKEPATEPAASAVRDGFGFGDYRDRPDPWAQVWTYRRIRSVGAEPAIGDWCLQNWGYYHKLQEGGNDYPFGYLFLPKSQAAAQRSDWQGGIDLQVLAAAEQRALGWHDWFKSQTPKPFQPEQVLLVRGALGTGHGLAKLPYIRDTRRSVGLDEFVLTLTHLVGETNAQTAERFPDRVAIGCYAADIHSLTNREYPPNAQQYGTPRPFYIPYRALTNASYDNLLVAGKTMAQTFMANSATRLHPIEWNSGTAAGVAAAWMSEARLSSRDVLNRVSDLQSQVRQYMPVDWTLLP